MNKTYGVKDESGCQAQSAMISPGNALLKIEGSFNPKNTQSFSEEINRSLLGGGEQKTIFKNKIEKIQ